MSSKKNKKSRESAGSQEGGEDQGRGTAVVVSKKMIPRKPIGTVSDRLVDKADRVYALINDALHLMVKRGVPSDVASATKTCLSQVEDWRESLFGLKSSGWSPPEVSKDIAEGDHVRIAQEARETYQYIFDFLGVVPGEEDLVAGLVVKTKRSSRVLVKKLAAGTPDELDGLGQPTHSSEQVFGYVPSTLLVKRPVLS